MTESHLILLHFLFIHLSSTPSQYTSFLNYLIFCWLCMILKWTKRPEQWVQDCELEQIWHPSYWEEWGLSLKYFFIIIFTKINILINYYSFFNLGVEFLPIVSFWTLPGFLAPYHNLSRGGMPWRIRSRMPSVPDEELATDSEYPVENKYKCSMMWRLNNMEYRIHNEQIQTG